MQAKNIVKLIGDFTRRNSRTILTSISIGAGIGATSMAVVSTVKATKLVEQTKREQNLEKISPKETVKLCWKLYIPTAVLTVASATCGIVSLKQADRTIAGLQSLYTVAASSLQTYQQKVAEIVDEKTNQEIKNAVAQEKVKTVPLDKSKIIVTGKGEVLCMDSLTGRYFMSDIQTLRRIQNDINQQIINEVWASLNDVYYEMGLPSVKLGDQLGWNTDNLLNFDFEACLTEDGEPCLVVEYVVGPKDGYSNVYDD